MMLQIISFQSATPFLDILSYTSLAIVITNVTPIAIQKGKNIKKLSLRLKIKPNALNNHKQQGQKSYLNTLT